MIIGKITLGKTIAMPGYNNDKPEIEAILEDGDTVESVLSSLNKRLIAWHKAEYPQLYQPENVTSGYYSTDLPNPPITTYPAPGIINIQDEKLEIEIDNCGTFEELLQWKQLHDVLPVKIVAYYSKRLKELSV